MLKIICLILLMLSLQAFAAQETLVTKIECSTEDEFETPECSKITQDAAQQVEYTPEQIDFDETKISISNDGTRLTAKANLKIAGRMLEASFFSGNLSALTDEIQATVKNHMSRIVNEAKSELERLKTERKKVVMTLSRVNISAPKDISESDLKLEAEDFLRTFLAATTELGQIYNRLMSSKLRTGAKLSVKDNEVLTMKFQAGVADLRQRGIELDVFTNCTDDRENCEAYFVDQYVRDNNKGQRQARILLEKFSDLHGLDLLADGSSFYSSSEAVSDQQGSKTNLMRDKISK